MVLGIGKECGVGRRIKISYLPCLHVAPARGSDPPLGSDSARGLPSSPFTLPQLAAQTRLVFRSRVKIWPIPTMLRELLQMVYLPEWNRVNRSV